MLDLYVTRGTADALRRFGFEKEANQLELPLGPTPAAPGGGFMDKAKAFGMGQVGHAKDLYGHLRQGLGGAATPEAGALARQNALGSLKGLAPTLAAGGALFLMHRHNRAKQEAEARQRAMMMQSGGGGGYPMGGGGYPMM
jgi:hypothetical protein